jgi:hypothetical protein
MSKLSSKVSKEIVDYVEEMIDACSSVYTSLSAIEIQAEEDGKKIDNSVYKVSLDDFMDYAFDGLIDDLNVAYGDNDEDDLDESLLTEKVWKKKMDDKVVKRFRDAIDYENYPVIRASLELIYRVIHQMYPDEFSEEDLQDKLYDIKMLPVDPNLSDELIKEYDINLDVDEYFAEQYDYELEQLYDICDTLSIWLPLD